MPFRWACAYGEDRIGLWQAFEVAGVRQVMRWIPPGEFLMESPEHEAERTDDKRQHRDVLTEGFWLADTACTQALWVAVTGENPSRFTDNPQNPVEQVSWLDITDEFLPKLNALAPGLQLELPTEAQWEYACRAGTTTPFSFKGPINQELVNYRGQWDQRDMRVAFRDRTVPVKTLYQNAWGLHQMHGNINEWCQDESPDRQRCLRGGGWFDYGVSCQSSVRGSMMPHEKGDNIGFRLARRAC
jgi:formylglycine-generating enzyme required for sulfatase activity